MHVISLRTQTHFRLLLQSEFYSLSAFYPQFAACSLQAACSLRFTLTVYPPWNNLLSSLEQLIKMIEDSKFFFEKFQRLSEDQGAVSDESLNFFDYLHCIPRGIVNNFIPSPCNKRQINYVAKYTVAKITCEIRRIIKGYPNLLAVSWYKLRFTTYLILNFVLCYVCIKLPIYNINSKYEKATVLTF